MSAAVLTVSKNQEVALVLADGRATTVRLMHITDDGRARLLFEGELDDVLILRHESMAPIMDAEILALHDAANILRLREQHSAAAAVFNALADLAGGGATGRGGIRSREPVDRDAAKRNCIAARIGSREAIGAACTRA